jgi:putative transposase
LTCLQELISPDPQVSVRHQCELLALSRSSYYYQCCPETEENLALMRRLDRMHLEHPVYGSRKLTVLLRLEGLEINRKRVVRLLRLMGIEAIYAKPRTSLPGSGHQIYPYLLRDLEVTGPDQVWCSDITYVPMARGFMYLVAVMDWWSRYVLGWRLSNTMEAAFCVDAWEAALRAGRQAPLISNTDQGSQPARGAGRPVTMIAGAVICFATVAPPMLSILIVSFSGFSLEGCSIVTLI